MKLLLGMNLSPVWVHPLRSAGWEAVHWSCLGDPRATDLEMMEFARTHEWVVFTHDLDFGTLLAYTRSGKPSVFQVRAQDVTPAHLGDLVLRTLRQFLAQLESGALVTLDEGRQRVRLLPLKS
jgi:predicted nuclease of predicted toxin-antitoxin system